MRTRARISAAVIRTVLAILAAAYGASSGSPAFGQVILEPDPTGTMTGTVGLTTEAGLPAETFSGGSISSSGGGFSYWADFGADGTFTVTVPADATLQLHATMSGFQNAGNATLSHTFQNIAAIPKGGTASIDMTRTGGRILARVNVTGGTVQLVSIQSWSYDSAIPAYFRGYVTGWSPTGSAEVIQPLPARPSTQVYGSVSIRLPAGCTKTLSLESMSIEVIAGTTTAVTWEGSALDVTGQACPTGDVAGSIHLNGLSTLDAAKKWDMVSVYGAAASRSVVTTSGSYEFLGLPTGLYSTQLRSAFNAPYNSMYFPIKWNALAIEENITTPYDYSYSVGAATFTLNTRGSWTTADANWGSSASLEHSTSGVQGSDALDPATGRGHFVVESGTNYLRSLQHAFYEKDDTTGRYFYEFLYHYPLAGSGRPEGTITEGVKADFGIYDHETSSSKITFQAAQAEGQSAVLLRDIQLSGTAHLRDAATGVLQERSDVSAYGYGAETSAITVTVRGVPGTYQMRGTAHDSGGTRYRKSFELILGDPENTPAGSGITQELTSTDGETTVSLTFDNVTQAGTTTISESTAGPNSPPTFAIFKSRGVNGATGQFYYDITTTAVFTGTVQVCLTYDETQLGTPEANLELGHYLEASNSWDIITQEGYPDTADNRICGLTESFSVFAGLEPFDRDGDGVLDANDNCPVTVNASQADLDGDGFGDACDADSDGDNIVNDEDHCPYLASSDNGDVDGDRIGDVCDPDIDGDLTANESDNCPRVANSDQSDFDSDGIGDQCDLDDDGDGVEDATDACPGTTLGALIDGQGCSSPQLFELVCSTAGVYKNHGEYVSCVASEANRQVTYGMITEDQKGAIVAAAAKSDIGKK